MRKTPFNLNQIKDLAKKHPTPFYIYDEVGIRESAKKLKKAFLWAPNFNNFFAVKALPNPAILKILKNEGFGTDCSSYPELLLSKRVGITGENVMFTSNDTPANEFKEAKKLGAIINLDDITHIDFLEKAVGFPNLISFRYNPGPARKGNKIIGDPKEAKYGLTKAQLFDAYKISKEKGASRFGLHTMLISNELNPKYFVDTANMLFDLAVEINKNLGIKLEFINLGGGIGIPYKQSEKVIDLTKISKGIKQTYKEKIAKNNLHPTKIYMECGRYITGPHGYLVSKVIHIKNTYKKFIGLDSTMANLMRPGMYGAHHEITIIGKEKLKPVEVYDVTGSLCENNDKFAINRKLPNVEINDYLAIHDAGAHGHSMGFNYNGKLRSAEFLFARGKFKMIRRAETVNDYFATLKF